MQVVQPVNKSPALLLKLILRIRWGQQIISRRQRLKLSHSILTITPQKYITPYTIQWIKYYCLFTWQQAFQPRNNMNKTNTKKTHYTEIVFLPSLIVLTRGMESDCSYFQVTDLLEQPSWQIFLSPDYPQSLPNAHQTHLE